MNREAQILQALANRSLSMEARRALTDELHDVRAEAARRHEASRSIDFDAASAHLTPVQPYVPHTAETDWLGRVAAHGKTAQQIHAAAKAEASRWFTTIHPQIVADRTEFAIQATGKAHQWAGQWGDDFRSAVASFLQQAGHLAGFKVAECSDDDSGEDGEDGDSNGDAEKSNPPMSGEDGEVEDDDDYDGPRKESIRRRVGSWMEDLPVYRFTANPSQYTPEDLAIALRDGYDDLGRGTDTDPDGNQYVWVEYRMDDSTARSWYDTIPGIGMSRRGARRRTATWTKTDQKGSFGAADVWQSSDPAIYAYVYRNSNSPRVRVFRSTPTGDAPGDGFIGVELVTLPLPSTRNIADFEIQNLLDQEAKLDSFTSSLRTAGETCGQKTKAQIGNQSEMTVTCHRPAGHSGDHEGITLDSDDNPITYRFSASTTASLRTAKRTCPNCGGEDVSSAATVLGSSYKGQLYCDDCKSTWKPKSASKRTVGYTNSYGLNDEGPTGMRRGDRVWIEGAVRATVLYVGFDDITNNLGINPEELGFKMYQDSYPVAVTTGDGVRIVQFDALSPRAGAISERLASTTVKDANGNDVEWGYEYDDDYDGPRKESSRRSARLVNVWDLQPGDVLLRGEGATPDPENDTVEKVDGVNGMWIVDFTNGQSTPPLGNGQVYVASRRTVAESRSDKKVPISEVKAGDVIGWGDDPSLDMEVLSIEMDPTINKYRVQTPEGEATYPATNMVTILASRRTARWGDNEVEFRGQRFVWEQDGDEVILYSLMNDGGDELDRMPISGWGEDATAEQTAQELARSWVNDGMHLKGFTGRRRLAADGQTCSVCGDKIAQTGGSWHHDNGEKHDHEAKPGGGDSKESSRRTAVSQDVAAASAFLGKLNEGDPVTVVIDGQEHQMAVSRRLSSGDPGGYGAMESSYVIVSFGPGRYSTNITVRQQASKSPGMPYIKDGTTASLRGSKLGSIPGVGVGDKLVIQGGFEVIVTDADPQDGGPAGRVMARYIGDDIDMAVTEDMIDRIVPAETPGEQLSLMGARRSASVGQIVRDSGWSAPLKSAQGESQPRTRTMGVDALGQGKGNLLVTLTFDWPTYEVRVDPYPGKVVAKGETSTLGIIESAAMDWIKKNVTPEWYAAERDKAVATASRRSAADIPSPSADSQNGYGESSLPDVTVPGAPEDTNLGWIDDDPEGAYDQAPQGSVGPFDASVRIITNTAGEQFRIVGGSLVRVGEEMIVGPSDAPEDTNLGWIAEGDPDAQDEFAFEAPDFPIANEASLHVGQLRIEEGVGYASGNPIFTVQYMPDNEDSWSYGVWENVKTFLSRDDAERYIADHEAKFPKDSSLHQAMPNPVDLGIQVGDIFYSSWGYDQTNVDFYQVVGLTGASVKVRQIAQRTVRSGGPGGDSVVAVPDHFVGEVMTKRIQNYSDRPSFSLNSYSDASLWDGTPKYQTAFGFGH